MGVVFNSTLTGRMALLSATLTVMVVLPEGMGRTQPKESTSAIFGSALLKLAEPVRSMVKPSELVSLTRMECGWRRFVRVIEVGWRRRSAADAVTVPRSRTKQAHRWQS